MAAVLTGGTEAVLSHRSAAALWGIRQYEGRGIDIALPRKSRSSITIRRHLLVLPSDEVTRVDGILVTTVPRTILDLATVSGSEAVESALRQAEYLRLEDRLALADLVARYPGRRGIRSVRTALLRRAESPGRPRSRLEERFLGFLDTRGLPRPQVNAWLQIGKRRFEVDCLWPAPRQIVELDGWRAHGTRTAFHEDRVRDRLLRANGYEVTRLTWWQLEDEPEAIAQHLRALSMSPAGLRGRKAPATAGSFQRVKPSSSSPLLGLYKCM